MYWPGPFNIRFKHSILLKRSDKNHLARKILNSPSHLSIENMRSSPSLSIVYCRSCVGPVYLSTTRLPVRWSAPIGTATCNMSGSSSQSSLIFAVSTAVISIHGVPASANSPVNGALFRPRRGEGGGDIQIEALTRHLISQAILCWI